MRVVMLTNTIAPDELGGLENYVRNLAAALVQTGCEVTVVAKRLTDSFPLSEVGEDGVRLRRYDVPSKRSPDFAVRYPVTVARAVHDALRESGDGAIVHAHFPIPALVPALRRRTFVYTLHAPVYKELLLERQGSYLLPKPLQRAAVAGLRRAERTVVRQASTIVTLSDFMRREVATLDAGAGQRTKVLAGGVATDVFTPGPTRHGDALGAPLLFAARRHVPRTGVRELVEAMPAVLAAIPNARLVLAGDGLQRPLVEEAIVRLGLSQSVTLIGRVSESELIDWYRRADIVVTPTQQLEGFGLATAEALACGSAVLVTPVGANPEVVAGLSADLISKGASPEDMAEAISSLWLNGVDTLAATRISARAAVHPSMSWSTIADEHVDLYSKVDVSQQA